MSNTPECTVLFLFQILSQEMHQASEFHSPNQTRSIDQPFDNSFRAVLNLIDGEYFELQQLKSNLVNSSTPMRSDLSDLAQCISLYWKIQQMKNALVHLTTRDFNWKIIRIVFEYYYNYQKMTPSRTREN